MSQAEIVASVLGADYSVLGEEVAELERAGVDRIQWDIMDGRFVPNLTFGTDVVAACRARTRSFGIRSGVALDPATPLESVRHVLDQVDVLLVLTVDPGFGGQAYLQTMEAKIAEARRLVAQSTGQASTGSAHDSHEQDLSADCQQRSHTSPRVAPPRLVPHPG